MSFERRLRLRCIAPLALCAVLCSSPAFAALVCAYTPACPTQPERLQLAAATNAHDSIASSKSCCPVHKRKPAMPSGPFDCCARGPADFLLRAAFSPGPHQRLIALRSSPFDSLPVVTAVPLASFEAASLYAKPVDHKKTDLRI